MDALILSRAIQTTTNLTSLEGSFCNEHSWALMHSWYIHFVWGSVYSPSGLCERNTKLPSRKRIPGPSKCLQVAAVVRWNCTTDLSKNKEITLPPWELCLVFHELSIRRGLKIALKTSCLFLLRALCNTRFYGVHFAKACWVMLAGVYRSCCGSCWGCGSSWVVGQVELWVMLGPDCRY